MADPALVERTVLLVRETDRAIATGKRRVGAMLLDEYFGGDPDLALARGPSRSKSYALLASVIEDTTGWDARDLNECVRIEIVARSLPPELADALAVSHLLRLSSLRNPRTREALARRIVAGELRGDRLKRLIAEEGAREDAAQPPGAPPKPDRPGGSLTGGGGPRRRPDAVVAVAALKRVMERAQDDHAFTAAEIREVRPKQRERLARDLDAASRKLARWSAKLRSAPE